MTETLIGSGLATRVRSDTTRALIRLFAGNVLTAVAYFVLSVPVAKYFGAYGFFPSPLWPGAGIALFAALIGGWRMAPGIFLGSLSANAILFGSPFNLVLAVTATNTLGPVVGAMLMRQNFPPRQPVMLFDDVRRFLRYGVGVHPFITAVGGATAETLLSASHGPWLSTFAAWFISDGAGTLLVATPTILAWIDRRRVERGRWLEMTIVSILILSVGSARLWMPESLPIPTGAPILIGLCCTWLLARFAPRDAMLLCASMSVLAVAGFVALPGEYPVAPDDQMGYVVGISVGVVLLNVLLVGVVMEERALAFRRLSQDDLTGLLNRQAFMRVADRELVRAERYGRPCTLCVFDVEGFPGSGSAAPSAVGDAVLRAIAGHAQAVVRPLDLLARIGGGEFAVLMPETDAPMALELAEQLCLAISNSPILADGKATWVGVNAGIAARVPGDTMETLSPRAHGARYIAKRQGRNRVAAA